MVEPLFTNMDSSGPLPPPQPKYVILQENSGRLRPPPYRRNVPEYHSNHHHKGGGNCCLRCICWFYCFLFILIFILALVAFFLFVIYQPQRPSYNVDNLSVNALNMQGKYLHVELEVVVKANNPNQEIGFTYGSNSKVIVLYQGSTLCSGKLPAFHQPRKNTSMVKVMLRGNSEFNSKLQEGLLESQQTKKVPLLIMVKAPVSIVLGNFPLRQVEVFVNCSLVIDNLAAWQKSNILSSNYSYGFSI